jgi:hypothetical protein
MPKVGVASDSDLCSHKDYVMFGWQIACVQAIAAA